MDIMLERVLSLIPKKPDGKYVHGAKKEFCESIGAPVNIISEWEKGKTKSYRNYIYAIADVCNVSIEWLKGETDEKGTKKLPTASGAESITELLAGLSPEKLKVIQMALALSDDAAKERLPAIELIFKE